MFFLIVPGIIYFIWKGTTGRRVCPQCGFDYVVVTGEPVATDPRQPAPPKPDNQKSFVALAVMTFILFGGVVIYKAYQMEFGSTKKPRNSAVERRGTLVLENPISTPIPMKRAVFAKGQVNIRSGPGTSFPVVRKTSDDELMPYAEKRGQWFKLKENGPQWVHESVVEPYVTRHRKTQQLKVGAGK